MLQKKKYDADLNRYTTLEEQGKLGSLEYPVYPDIEALPKYPEYPSMDEIKDRATFIRNFCDDKGNVPEPKNWREELSREGGEFKENVSPYVDALRKGTGISS